MRVFQLQTFPVRIGVSVNSFPRSSSARTLHEETVQEPVKGRQKPNKGDEGPNDYRADSPRPLLDQRGEREIPGRAM
jgi:hypothetical protein